MLAALGVRGMKLSQGDSLEHAYLRLVELALVLDKLGLVVLERYEHLVEALGS